MPTATRTSLPRHQPPSRWLRQGPTFGHWLSVSHNCCSFSTVYFIFKIVFVNSFIQPSLRLCKPTYSVLVPKPRNRESCGKKSIQRKNTLGCMAGLTGTRCGCRRPASDHSTVRGVTEMGLPVLDVAAAGLLVMIVQWEVWLRWVNQGPRSSNAKYKGSVGSCPWDLSGFFRLFPLGFPLLVPDKWPLNGGCCYFGFLVSF